MRKGQKYVVQANQKSSGKSNGLGHDYRKGDYITFTGRPTRKLDEAYVYTHGNWEEDFFDELSDEHRALFDARPVKLVTVVRLDETPKPKRKQTDVRALCRKAYHPSRLTDRELAQVRRSSSKGANTLDKVTREQERRGLLDSNGREKLKRISDYPEGVKSPRLF